MQSMCRFALVVALLTETGCSDNQAPSPDGPLFLAASVDGRSWAPGPEPGDLYALLGPQRVILTARRPTVQPPGEERLVVEFGTTDIFEHRNYRLAWEISGFATFQVFTQPPGGPSEAFYSTSQAHSGTLTIQASNAVDSTITGAFAFDAAPLSGDAKVHRFSGQ